MGHTAELRIAPVLDGSSLEQARLLLREYNEHLYTFIDRSLLRHREDELQTLSENFVPPAGALLLASQGSQALGCIGVRPLRSQGLPHTAEICRLWVTPSARGQALGRQLLQCALGMARQAAYSAAVLNSIDGHMGTAQTLYTQAGFRPTAAYKHVPLPNVVYYRVELVEAGSAAT